MKITVLAYSRQGCRIARKVLNCFPDDECRGYTMQRFGEDGFLPIWRPAKPFYGELFRWSDAMVFVGSCGIAVREIAPHLRDKRTDPAVICMDELGRFVIPILSGHIGGANEIAEMLAVRLNATPVITTATDIHNKFAVDAWAAKQGFIIDNIHRAKVVSAAILERNVPLSCDFPIITDYPNGVVPGETGDVGICITFRKKAPFLQTLRLIPPILHLGIGCRKGTSADVIHNAIQTVLEQHQIDPRAVKCVASIDLKAAETGLLEYCGRNQWPVVFYSAEELQRVKGDFSASEFVERVTGVDNVCERAALVGAETLVVRKTAVCGVTVAIAAERLEVRFG